MELIQFDKAALVFKADDIGVIRDVIAVDFPLFKEQIKRQAIETHVDNELYLSATVYYAIKNAKRKDDGEMLLTLHYVQWEYILAIFEVYEDVLAPYYNIYARIRPVWERYIKQLETYRDNDYEQRRVWLKKNIPLSDKEMDDYRQLILKTEDGFSPTIT